MQLSENFTLEEMTRSETARKLRILNTPPAQEMKNLQILCQQVLEPARKIVGRPLIITSGYRCKQLNKAVGGVANSYHIQGRAADILVNGEDDDAKLRQSRDLANALNLQPLTDLVLCEYSPYSMWVHVQWSSKPRHKVNLHYPSQHNNR